MSFRLTSYIMNSQSQIGGQGNFGDARFGYQWAVDNARFLSEPVTPAVVGSEKLVPMDEIKTDRYYEIQQNKAYFNNTPPTPELDKDDPNQDMARIFNPIPKQIVKKGALFLFGQQKFKGIDSFRIQNKNLAESWARIWTDNNMDTKLIDQAQSYLRDGDVFYKAISKKTGLKVTSETEDAEGQKTITQMEEGTVKFLKTDAGNWSAVVSVDNPDVVIAWIYQFEKEPGKYTREEYFRDKTLYYEGEVNAEAKKDSKIFNIGLFGNQRPVEEKVKFVLKSIEEHNLGIFPLVRVKNNEQSTFWGPSIYLGHYGQFDRLNEVYTQLGYAIKMMADPLLWIAGAEAADQNTKAADAVWSFTDPQATLNVLQWPGIPDSIFKYIDLLESKIYDDAFVPRTNDIDKLFGSENRMSGSGIRELKGDIVDATMARRNDFEEGFKQMLELTALLLDIKVPEKESSVDVVWGPVFESGTSEKREALLKYYEQKIITRETVIELSDDFPPQMKEELIADLTTIDQEQVKMTAAMTKASTAPVAPAAAATRRARARPRRT